MEKDNANELKVLTDSFNALCDEQESLNRKGFTEVFEVLDEMEEAFTPQHPYTENEDNINKALQITGHSSDEAFCKAFKRNNQIMIDGKKIQDKGLEILAMQQYEKIKEEPKSPHEWRFVSIYIVAPKQIHEEIIAPMMEADAKEGKGLFSNVSDIEEESEDEDDLLMVKIYNCEATLTRYWDELKQFGVIGKRKSDAFFKYEFRTILLKVLNELATFISQNTDKPALTKNHIASTIKVFDKMTIWGLFFQILTLQGLCQWLESVNISEGDNGFDEAKSLHNWLCERLVDKEMAFCYMPFGDEDKKQLKPLCNFLHSTEIGKAVQDFIFGDNEESEPQQNNDTQHPDEPDLPSEPTKRASATRGRQSKSFQSYVNGDVDKRLERLHSIMKVRTGKGAALVIKVAISEGWINKPTFRAVAKEFGDIGNQSGYNKAMRENTFTDDEIQGVKSLLNQ